MHHLFSRAPTLVLLFIFVTTTGCGTAEYEKLMAERLTILERQSRFDALYEPAQLKRAGEPYPLTMRWPKLFEDKHWFSEAYRDGKPIEKKRTTPFFLDEFPGFLLLGEAGLLQSNQRFLKYYCYVGVVDANETPADDLQAELVKQIKSDPDMTIDQPWHTVELEKPVSGTVTWRHLRATGEQHFERVRRMSSVGWDDKLDGAFDIYLYETDQYLVLWAIRVPAEIADKINLVYQAEATAGSIVFDESLLEETTQEENQSANDPRSTTE